MLLTLAEAKDQARVLDNAEDALILRKLEAAEQAAIAYLDRAVFADDASLLAAKAAAPVSFAAAVASYRSAILAAQSLDDDLVREDALQSAEIGYLRARTASRQVADGIVITEKIRAGILLIFGSLFMQREDVVIGATASKLPDGAYTLLWQDRAGIGL